MFLKNTEKIKALEQKLYLVHQQMLPEINKIFKVNSNEEDIKSKSNIFYQGYDYYLIMMLLVLIENYIKNNITTWEETQLRFNLECIKDKLYCKNININDYLFTFGLPAIEDTPNKPITTFSNKSNTTVKTMYENPQELINNKNITFCYDIISGEKRVDPYKIITKTLSTSKDIIITDTKKSIKI